jgi:hypothetical protein
VFIGAINFDDLTDNDVITTYKGLIWDGWEASLTIPAPPSPLLGAVATSLSSTIELASGVFSMISVDIAGDPPSNPVTVIGYDSSGTVSVSKTIAFTTLYVTYDLSEFTNIAKVEFQFTTAAVDFGVIDNLILV